MTSHLVKIEIVKVSCAYTPETKRHWNTSTTSLDTKRLPRVKGSVLMIVLPDPEFVGQDEASELEMIHD